MPRERTQDSRGMTVLDDYRAARQRSPVLTLRDRIATVLCNSMLRLASREYRDLFDAATHEGMLCVAEREGKIAPRFREPLDDDHKRVVIERAAARLMRNYGEDGPIGTEAEIDEAIGGALLILGEVTSLSEEADGA